GGATGRRRGGSRRQRVGGRRGGRGPPPCGGGPPGDAPPWGRWPPPPAPAPPARRGGGPPPAARGFSPPPPPPRPARPPRRQIGVYQCFGAWTAAGTDTNAPDQRFTAVQYNLAGRGAIMGLVNEGGARADDLVGAITGGTGEFLGAQGSFRQVTVSAGPPIVF